MTIAFADYASLHAHGIKRRTAMEVGVVTDSNVQLSSQTVL